MYISTTFSTQESGIVQVIEKKMVSKTWWYMALLWKSDLHLPHEAIYKLQMTQMTQNMKNQIWQMYHTEVMQEWQNLDSQPLKSQ